MSDEGPVAAKTIRPGAASRRQALGMMGTSAAVGLATTALPALGAQPPAAILRGDNPVPLAAPRADLVNVPLYEAEARNRLGAAKAALITGSDRTVTDRITLRPRMNIVTRDLDMTVNLFGDDHFTPIIVGPIADQKRFHAEGEVATARGASAAKAAMVVSSDASMPLAQIAQATTAPVWLQVHAGSPKVNDALAQAQDAKVRAVVVTVNANTAATRIDWALVDAVAKKTTLPVIVKGITRPEEARQAVARGAKGVIVSNWRGGDASALPGTLLLLGPVVQAVGAQVPVLVDGSFRRGTDILKALGLGAKAVLVGRPVMWGLAAYGAEGVQGVVETLQTELGRYMCMCGRPSIAAIDSSVLRVHAPVPPARTTP